MEYRAELLKVDTLMEYHEELVRVDILMEYHEKSVMVDSLMECHEEFVGVYLHTRDDVGFGTSVDLWKICIQRLRPTVDVNLSSGHCESARTRQVLISCVSDHARCLAPVQV